MASETPSLVFFGSGPLALESLRYLQSRFAIEAVITKPRPDHHHGEVPVLDYCIAEQMTYYTPARKAELSELFAATRFNSPLGIVIDYGIIIAADVIESFALGIINSHFSLLPEWRGADPITFAILSGQSRTGVSLMLINDKMDEGPLLAQAELPLGPAVTTPELTASLIDLSNAMLTDIIPSYVAGAVAPVPQSATIADTQEATYSRKLTKADGLLDWQKSATQLEREIRAFIEWPKTKTTLAGKEIVVTQAHVVDRQGIPGSHIVEPNKSLIIYCGEDALALDQVKPAGKNEMPIAAFLAGYGHLL